MDLYVILEFKKRWAGGCIRGWVLVDEKSGREMDYGMKEGSI